MRTGIVAVACCAAAAALCGCQSMDIGADPGVRWDWTSFGDQPMGPGDAVDIASLSGGEQQVVIHGVITGVCQAKGCWMTLQDDTGNEIFVRCREGAFAIPHGAAGRYAVIHGSTELGLASVQDLRQYAEQANKTPGEINLITQPVRRLTFHADSVLIAGDGLDQQ